MQKKQECGTMRFSSPRCSEQRGEHRVLWSFSTYEVYVLSVLIYEEIPFYLFKILYAFQQKGSF